MAVSSSESRPHRKEHSHERSVRLVQYEIEGIQIDAGAS
jgi:hypothetical protein